MSRWGDYEVRAYVDFDRELSDEDVLDMARGRGLIHSKAPAADKGFDDTWDDLEREARAAYQRRDAAHFDVVLLRMRALANVPEPPGAPALFDDEAPRSKPANRH